MSQANTDYTRIERALHFLADAAPGQPSLSELAAHVGLSVYHMQRLFTRWAGISPKRFLQVQTLGYAKDALSESRAVLGATYESGLSSPGRLHDLFVTLEAVTPGEYRRGGAGLRIGVAFCTSPFGEALVGVTERGICALTFCDGDRDEAWRDLVRRWPAATIEESPRRVLPLARRLFEAVQPSRDRKPLALLVRGTNFQVQVWQALLRIPPGGLVTYGDIATVVGAPAATRAVGTAVGANPIAFLIPCHRVIQRSGALGGYRWGETRKRALLTWEAGATPAARDLAIR